VGELFGEVDVQLLLDGVVVIVGVHAVGHGGDGVWAGTPGYMQRGV